MPKVTCNGFSMFAQHKKPELEQVLGRRFNGLDHELIKASTPYWNKLSFEEKQIWKQEAKNYKRSEEYIERKRMSKGVRSFSPPKTAPKRLVKKEQETYYPGSEEFADVNDLAYGVILDDQDNNGGLEEDFNSDKGTVGSGSSNTAGAAKIPITVNNDPKRQQDRQRLLTFFQQSSGGTIQDVKRCRFVFITMRTHAPLDDGQELPAEIALYEFSLHKGILDTYNRIIGPWDLHGAEAQRAIINANETHELPVSGTLEVDFTSNIKELLREILGRAEPGEAYSKGLQVGLYKNGLIEEDDDQELTGGTSTGHYSMGKRRTPVLPGDIDGRRWLVCLQSEMLSIISAIKCMMQKQELQYSGFPTEPERFVYLDTLIDAYAMFVGAEPEPDYKPMVDALQDPQDPNLCTIWDRRPDMYCSYHKPHLNRYCSVSVARRALFVLFHALREPYSLPFRDYKQT